MSPRRLAIAALVSLAVALAVVLLRPGPPPAVPPRGPDAPPRARATVDAPSASPAAVVRPSVPSSPSADASADAVVAAGPWGDGPGAFGRQLANESNPENPMSFAVAPDGTVLVVDQVNRRVMRSRGHGFEAALSLPNAATQDLALTSAGRVVTLDRLVDANVRIHGPDGRTLATVPLVGGPIAEGGLVTAVFADDRGVYVEREHAEVVRVASPDGTPDPARPTLWGRPSRDGRSLLRVAIADRAAGVLTVQAASRENGAMDWSARVPVGAMIFNVVLLDSDRAGNVYVGASVATPQPGDPPAFSDPAVVVARLDPAAAITGTLRLPPPPDAAEVFRPLCVDDDGSVYEMVAGEGGLEVRRWRFPSGP